MYAKNFWKTLRESPEFHLGNFKIDKNAQEKFSDEIRAKFKMSRLLKILLVDSSIFIATSNKKLLIVFRKFRINSPN